MSLDANLDANLDARPAAAARSPSRGILRVAGYDSAGKTLPEPVTQIREIAVARASQPA
jgi:hypothetical protein